MKCPSNMVQKVDIKEVVENGVVFQDESYEQVDSILYCTGISNNDILIYIYIYKIICIFITNQISYMYIFSN